MPRPAPDEFSSFTASERDHILRVRWNMTLEESEFRSLQSAIRHRAGFADKIQDELELRATEPLTVTSAHFEKVRQWFLLGQYTPTGIRRGTWRKRRTPRVPFDSEMHVHAMNLHTLTLAPAFGLTPAGRGGVGSHRTLVWCVNNSAYYSLPFRAMQIATNIIPAEVVAARMSAVRRMRETLVDEYRRADAARQSAIATEYQALGDEIERLQRNANRASIARSSRAMFIPIP